MPERAGDAPELGLLDYLRIIRRRGWVVVLAILAITGTVVALSLEQDKVYRADGELLLQPLRADPLAETPVAADPGTIETEVLILESPDVSELVAQKLGSAPDITAEQVSTTHIVEISAEDTDPERAAETVNAYARAYIEVRSQQETDAVLAAAEKIQIRITDVEGQIAEIDSQILAVPEDQRADIAAGLQAERDALDAQRLVFQQLLDELTLESELASGGPELVRPAVAPENPVRPNPVRNGLVAAGIGLVLGMALALLFDYLDDSIKSTDDLDRAAAGRVPVLGHVPVMETKGKRPTVASLNAPTSPAAEAYRSLRTAVQFLSLDRPLRTLQVTSPIAAEGKTTTVANLAAMLARTGEKVLILDCDLRRPRIHEYFGASNERGLTSVLLGDSSLEAAVQTVPGEENLQLVPSGPITPNPAELLTSGAIAGILQALSARCDTVVIDSPPILPVTDAAIVSTFADATLMVVMAGFTTRKRLQRALFKLDQVHARVVGTVCNRAAREPEYGYGYRHYGRRATRAERISRREARRAKRAARR